MAVTVKDSVKVVIEHKRYAFIPLLLPLRR
jgi:hypothetical protein